VGRLDPAKEHYDGKDLREANELKWELFLERGLTELGKDTAAIRDDLKSANWKVMLASALKRSTSATNVWIAGKLNMGIPQAVSQNVGKFYEAGGHETEAYQGLIIRITECPFFHVVTKTRRLSATFITTMRTGISFWPSRTS